MYDAKQFKKAGIQIDKVSLIIFVVFLLVVFRFINVAMWWYVNHLELNQKPQGTQFKYTTLYFSSYEKAMKKLAEFSQEYPKADVTVVSVFNLLNPGFFLVHNTVPFSAVDLGRMVVPLKIGHYTIKWHQSGFTEKKWYKQTQKGFANNSLLGKVLFKDLRENGDMSFILKPLENSSYLKIPYLVYFFLPLVLLLIFASMYSQAVFAGFFYYAGLFFLFDFKSLFFSVPLGWMVRIFGIKDITSFENIAAIVVFVLFTLLGVVGIVNWKERREMFKENLIVIVFIILPLFLRF